MLNLLSGVSPEIRVIMLFGLIGLIILIAGSVLLVGMRRQSIENAGRFDIPARLQKAPKPKKVKPAKPAKAPKPEKAAKPEKVKAAKPEKAPKPVKAKGGLFGKKAAKPTGVTLLAAPVGSAAAEQMAPKPNAAAAPVQESKADVDFDIPDFTTPVKPETPSNDDFDIPTFDAPPAPRPTNPSAPTAGPFGKPAPAGDDEW